MYMLSVVEKKPYLPKTMKFSAPHEGQGTSYSSSFDVPVRPLTGCRFNGGRGKRAGLRGEVWASDNSDGRERSSDDRTARTP
jgi:hypothetical protein